MMADGAGTSSFWRLETEGEDPMISSPEGASCFKYNGMTCTDRIAGIETSQTSRARVQCDASEADLITDTQ